MQAHDSVGDGCRLAGGRSSSGSGWLQQESIYWLQQEAMHPALIFSKQEAIYVAVVLYFTKVALYFPKPAATYTGAYAEQAARMHGSPCSSGWKQFMPAQFPQQRPSVKPGPAQDSGRDGGRLAGCGRKHSILPLFHRSRKQSR